MRKEIGVRLFILSVILAVVVIALLTYSEFTGSSTNHEPVFITVNKGMSFYELSIYLQKKKVVKSAFVLRKMAEQSGVDKKLTPGTYKFYTYSDYEEVLKVLSSKPEVETVKITIPEGFSNRQVAKRISEVFGFREDEVLNFINTGKPYYENSFTFLKNVPSESLEGFLFPDTYIFRKNEKLENIIKRMLENFKKKAEDAGLFSSSLPAKDFYQVLIIASIVEKEAKVEDERPLVASVFYNRIKRGMKLQSCATVEYILGFTKPQLTLEDLKLDSPYNTYKYSGLPPTPICNPGKASIQAAVKPAKTNYLYFVLKNDKGQHYFAETYSEFLKVKNGSK